MTPQPHLSTINERLSLALESSRQIAFDWHIPNDSLYFSGELVENFQALLLDTRKAWSSSALPEIIHNDDQENFRKHLHDALKGKGNEDGTFCSVELRLKDTLRAWRWVNISGKIVERDSKGRAIRMVGTFSDIEERKQTENKIARLRDLYAALSQTNQAIVRINDQTELLQEICRIAVEHGRFQLAWIGLRNHENNRIIRAAAYGNDIEILEDATISANDAAKDSSLISTALMENRPSICNDFGRAPSLSKCSKPAHAGFGSVASFPFKIDEKSLGALNLYSTEKDFFDEQLIDLLREMTADISFAIENYEREKQRKTMEAALMDSERFKSAILTAALDCIISINHEGEVISFNTAAERTFGYDSEEVLGGKLIDIIIPLRLRERYRRIMERRLNARRNITANRHIELKAMRSDGTVFPIELAAVPLSIQNKPIFAVFIRDITERKRVEMLQLVQNRILNMIAIDAALSAILTEIAQFVERQSDGCVCSILQLNSDGTTLSNRIAPSLPPAYLACLGDTEVGPCHGSSGTAVYRAQPVIVTDIATDPLWESRRTLALEHGLNACSSWPIFGKNRKILGAFALYFSKPIAPSAQDLQLLNICTQLAGIAIESRVSDEKIRYLAHYDGLTSLPNRFLFKEYFDLALRNAKRRDTKFAVFFLDLDKFKEVNDTLGHDTGDLVLREMARRLRCCLRHTDKIARMGGDEFYVLIEELSDGRYAIDVAQKLLDAASHPVRIGNHDCQLSVSIGISIYPDDGCDEQMLLKNADSAMYRAKELGKNAYQFFSSHTEYEKNKVNIFKPQWVARMQDGTPAQLR